MFLSQVPDIKDRDASQQRPLLYYYTNMYYYSSTDIRIIWILPCKDYIAILFWSEVNFIWHSLLFWTNLIWPVLYNHILNFSSSIWSICTDNDKESIFLIRRRIFKWMVCSPCCHLHLHQHHHHHLTVCLYFNSNWTRGTSELLLLLPDHFESDISKVSIKHLGKSSALGQFKYISGVKCWAEPGSSQTRGDRQTEWTVQSQYSTSCILHFW